MRVELRCLFLLATVLTLGIEQASAQAATGPYAFGTFESRGVESVNVGNLNVHLDIPVFHKAGRGIPFAYDLTFDNSVWQPVGVAGSQTWLPAQNFGWLAQTVVMTGYLSYSTHEYLCDYPPPERANYWIYDSFVYHDPWGGSHSFDGQLEYDPSGCDSTINSFTSGSADGSGYTLTATRAVRYGPLSQQQITSSYGRSLIVPTSPSSVGSTITDSNGNQVSVSSSGVYTDTLGTSALTVAGAAPGNVTLTYPNASGGTASYTIKYATYNIQTNFGCSGIGEYSASGTSLISEIDLPDGTNYLFSYELTPGGSSGAVTGRLASVILPTGGSISYSYSGGCNGNGINADGTVGSLTRTTSDGTKTYTRSTVNANATSTDVQDEAGKHTVYQFTMASNRFYETHRQVHDGDTSAPVLLDRYTCYNGAAPSCDGAAMTIPISETITVSSLNGGQQATVTNLYDASGSLTSSSVQDYGGAALESQSISYNSLEEPNQIKVLDPASNLVSQTTYEYDQTARTPTSGIPQHISGVNSGNQTSSDTWLNTDPSHDYKTSTLYYDTGVPISSTDMNGTTQFVYDSTQTFATQTTPPTPSSGVSLPSYASYDANSGVQLSASDANYPSTAQVQYSQYDNILRPKQINMIDGGSTTYNYSATDTEVSQAMGGGSTTDTHTLVDGYGRKSRVAVYNGQSSNPWYQIDYCYNAVGLLQFQSTEYQGNGWGTPKQCSGPGTTYTYDALGRVTNINNADGNTQYSYNSRAVKVTDVNGVQNIIQTDALGRTTKVCEITGTPLEGDPLQDCASDIAGTGYLTSYAYDLANHKVTITQGAQTRIFQTDSLGRTIFTQEPESGQTSYSYAYNGTGLVVTRIRPRANQTNPSVTTVTTTQYDAVGRPISVSYNDGTQPFGWSYDVSQGWPDFTQNNVKGHLDEASRFIGSSWAAELFSYDAMGRVAVINECLPLTCGNHSYDKQLPYTYDLVGNLTSSGDGAGVTTNYTYSVASEVTGMSSSLSGPTYPSTLLSNVQYGPAGPNTYSLGNGINVYSTYDSLNRLNGRWFCTGSAPAQMYCPGGTQMYAYQTSWQGSRSTSSSDTAQSQGFWYGYDEFNRLTSSTSNYGTPQSFTYQYDRYGNRWAQNVTQGSGPAPSFTFNKANNEITNSGYVYDAAGNLIHDASHSYTYDPEGNLTQVDGGSTATYSYNSLNQRVRVVWNGGSQEIVFGADGKRTSTWDGSSGALEEGVTYWGGQPLEYYANGYAHYLHTNWVGTVRMVTNNTAGVDGEFTSLPFGDAWTVTSGVSNDGYQFAGLDWDSTDIEHAQFRQISTTEGRWLSPDPYSGSYDMSDPQSFNRYTYVQNSPLSSVDPMGLDPCDGGFKPLVLHAHDEGDDDSSTVDCSSPGQGAGAGYGATPDPNPPPCLPQNGCYNVSTTPLPPPPPDPIDICVTQPLLCRIPQPVPNQPNQPHPPSGNPIAPGGYIIPPGMNTAAQAAKAAAKGRPPVTPRNIPENPPLPAPGYPGANEPPGPGTGQWMYILMQILRIIHTNANLPLAPIMVNPCAIPSSGVCIPQG